MRALSPLRHPCSPLTSFLQNINALFRNEEKQITTTNLLTEILFEGLTKCVVSLT